MPLSTVTALVARITRAARRRVVCWSVVMLALLVLALCFDATWWRPFIQHYVEQRSARRVDFEDLDVGIARDGDIVVGLRGLEVQNAPWAQAQPLVKAAQVTMRFSWRSLWSEQFIITHLTLVDAQVDLERRSDGLRNWRLTRPNDRGPGRVRVQAVNAVRTQARIIDGTLGLEVDLASTPIFPARAAPTAAPAGSPALVHHVSLQGNRRGTGFKAQVDVSEWVTMTGTGQGFSLQGVLDTSQARLEARGLAGDVAGESIYQGQWVLDGRGVSELAAVLGPAGQATPVPWGLPVKASAALNKQGARWQVSGLQARMGRSDLSGDLALEKAADPGATKLQGVLRSNRLDTAEWRQSMPGGSHFAAPGGNGLQAEIDWQVQQLSGLPPADWEAVSAHVSIHGRRATLSPLKFRVWGGQAAGRIQVDGSSAPLSLSAELKLPAVPLAKLAGGQLADQGLAGDLAAQLALSARGYTAQELAAAVQGEVTAELLRATLPAALEAKLGLDGGRWLRSLVGRDERVSVTCSALALHFENGVGQVRHLGLDTPHLGLSGKGQVDLKARRFELWLAPRRKQSALLALDRWLHVRGSAAGLQVATALPSGAAPASPCRPPA